MLGGPRVETTGKVKKLEAEIERLREELHTERLDNVRLHTELNATKHALTNAMHDHEELA